MIWIEAARPKTLIASLSPICIGNAIVYSHPEWSLNVFLCTLIAALSIQIGTNYVNDYADALHGRDTAIRKGPRRLTSAGCVTPRSMKIAASIAFVLAFLSSLFLIYKGGYPIALLTLISIGLGYLYSLTRFSLSSTGTADVFVLLFFGVLATGFSAYLQTGFYLKEAFLAGLAPGALSTAILAINNLRDYEEDLLTNKRTLIVRLGRKAGCLEYLFATYLAAMTPCLLILLTKGHVFSLMATFSLFTLLPLIHNVFQLTHLPQVLSKTGFALFLYTLLFTMGWNL
ncbi:MAG: 1,4-dihydroxy-2-naphthoate octaprenyltransferase [Simkaniaceae bacterium]|nr:1,4-dihydroxy-2-naphthoate octaprenyltransferase [Simkaniaceae bacterium]